MYSITEDYYKAQKDRRVDYFQIIKGNRKAMAMHLGGIYIECLLKGVIIKKYDILKASKSMEINKVRCICWYNEKNYLETIAISNPTNQDYYNKRSAKNPQHDLILAIRQLEELYDKVPRGILDKLRMINKPIHRKSYIDIRYMCEDEITDELYNEWENSFKGFIAYYDSRKKLFSFK